ncbi:MAG: hypothetical protein MK033_01625 [Candidatus Caenarcaniphilales bacterium]|nr:hypothetical protein [Candidatus Caenarcaniphilales bacterium]
MDSLLSNYFNKQSDYEWIINKLSDKLQLNDDEKSNLKNMILKNYTPLILFKDIKNMQDFIDYIGYVDLENDPSIDKTNNKDNETKDRAALIYNYLV